MVTPDYFKTYGIQMVRGRAFTDQDTADTVKVAVVNEEVVRTSSSKAKIRSSSASMSNN